MFFAICPSCGRKKRRPDVKCGGCGFDPAQNEDAMAKSVYLSLWRYEKSEERVPYSTVLRDLSADLHEGKEVTFDASELTRITERLRSAAPTSGERFAVIARLFLQVFVVCLVLVMMLGLLSMVRRLATR